MRQTSEESEESRGTEGTKGWSVEQYLCEGASMSPEKQTRKSCNWLNLGRFLGYSAQRGWEPHSFLVPCSGHLLHSLSYLCLGHTPYDTGLRVFPMLCTLFQHVIRSRTLPGAATQNAGTVLGWSLEPQDLTLYPWRQGRSIFPK